MKTLDKTTCRKKSAVTLTEQLGERTANLAKTMFRGVILVTNGTTSTRGALISTSARLLTIAKVFASIHKARTDVFVKTD